MHPRRRFLLRQNDDARLPNDPTPSQRIDLSLGSPTSRPSLSGGDHYVTPSPCEDEGQNPEKKLGNSRSGCFGDSSLPGGGAGLSSAQETGENRTAVPEAVTMSMPLSEPSVS